MAVTGQQTRGIVPSATDVITLAYTNATTANTWMELIASTTAAIYVTAIIVGKEAGTISLGTGAAASELVIADLKTYIGNTEFLALRYPIRIPSGTRVSVRHSLSSAAAGITYVAEAKVV